MHRLRAIPGEGWSDWTGAPARVVARRHRRAVGTEWVLVFSATKKPMAPGRRAKCAAARGLVLAFRVSRGAPAKSRKGKSTGKSSLKGKKVPPKYRSPSGDTWAGRGAKPRWMVAALKKGKKIESFLIKR